MFFSTGTYLMGMNVKVYVPLIIVPNTWDNLPKSFANYLNHMSLSGPFIRCLYPCTCPVIGFRTEFAWSKICSNANAFCGFIFIFEYVDMRLYVLISGEPSGFTLGEPSAFTLGAPVGITLVSSLGYSGGMRCGPLSHSFVLVWSCFTGMFSIVYI